MTKHLLVPERSRIAASAASANLELSPEALRKTAIWLEQLVDWNKRLDLTAARSTDELADLMLADAFLLAARVPKNLTVVDVGTGAGAPGLALALARPDLSVTLVEPLAKRVAFLRTVLAAAGREDVGLLRMKAEELETCFDVAVARATFAPDAWLQRGVELVVPGGSVWVLLAKEGPPENPRAKLAEDISYTWPATGAARRAVRYTT